MNGVLIKMHWIYFVLPQGWLLAWKNHRFHTRMWMLISGIKLLSCFLSGWPPSLMVLSIWVIVWNHWGIIPHIGDGWLNYLKERYKTGLTGFSLLVEGWSLLKLFSWGWLSTGLLWLDALNLFWMLYVNLFSLFFGALLMAIRSHIWLARILYPYLLNMMDGI